MAPRVCNHLPFHISLSSSRITVHSTRSSLSHQRQLSFAEYPFTLLAEYHRSCFSPAPLSSLDTHDPPQAHQHHRRYQRHMVLPLPVLWSASTYYKCSTLAMHCLTKMACACTYVRMYNAEFRLSNLNTLYVRMCNAHSLVIGWPMMMMMMIMGWGRGTMATRATPPPHFLFSEAR